MKISVSGKAVFAIKVALVCVMLALAVATCIFGSLAVSGEGELGRYLPDVAESEYFRACLVATLTIVVVTLIFSKIADKVSDSAKDEVAQTIEDEGENLVSEKGSRLASVSECISRCLSVLPAIAAFYVFYFALSDESLGSWGNAVLVAALVSGVFFILKIFKDACAGRVIGGFGVFALCAIIIASLYLDHEIELNSDFKLLVQFGAGGIIIGTIADIRNALSRIQTAWYIALKATGFILCGVCAAVILSPSVMASGLFPSAYFVYSRLCFACVISYGVEVISALVGERSRYI